jgi:preprotein translocase subunit SecG
VLAAVFFVATLAMAYFGSAQPSSGTSVLEGAAQPAAPAPAAQIPGNAPQAGPAPAPAAPSAPGAGQIPAK